MSMSTSTHTSSSSTWRESLSLKPSAAAGKRLKRIKEWLSYNKEMRCSWMMTLVNKSSMMKLKWSNCVTSLLENIGLKVIRTWRPIFVCNSSIGSTPDASTNEEGELTWNKIRRHRDNIPCVHIILMHLSNWIQKSNLSKRAIIHPLSSQEVWNGRPSRRGQRRRWWSRSQRAPSGS